MLDTDLEAAGGRQEYSDAGTGQKFTSTQFFISLYAWLSVGEDTTLMFRLSDVGAEMLRAYGYSNCLDFTGQAPNLRTT